MAAVTSTSEFGIVTVPADDDGCLFFLEQYKPFRLVSLQQEVDAFGSTYAREVAFDDAAWLDRAKNPLATTFVAVRSDDGRVVASTSLIGPLPSTEPASNPYQVACEQKRDRSAPSDDGSANDSDGDVVSGEPMCFQMSAVYTSPEARGRGLAKSLIKAAAEEACDRARRQRRPLALSVVVYAANSAAISVYERCGFLTSPGRLRSVFNPHKDAHESQLEMYFQGHS